MQPNLGMVDRYGRLVVGLLALGCAASSRRPSLGKSMLMSFGAMKVAEGVTGWCPLIELVQRIGGNANNASSADATSGSKQRAASQGSASQGDAASDTGKPGGDAEKNTSHDAPN